MPASLAPGTSASPAASRVAARSAVKVRSATLAARACRGVSITSAPPTENASVPRAAPLMKARRSMSCMIVLPRSARRYGSRLRTQNSTLKSRRVQAGRERRAAGSALLRLGLLRLCLLRLGRRGWRHGGGRRAGRPAAQRRRVRRLAEEGAEHGVYFQRIAAGINEHINLLRRQP